MEKILIGENSWFYGKEIKIGKSVKIGTNVNIRSEFCEIGDYCNVGNNNQILCESEFILKSNGIIGSNNNFCARRIYFDEYLFLDSNVIVGHGGRFGYDSFLTVGKGVMICANVKLNTNYSIKIGNDVGIGEYVDIWTHGAYPSILDGFPSEFGPVEIGSSVWIPAKSTVLANVKIGNNVVIGVNSLINKNLPDGCFAAGIPVKIIKENVYPKRDATLNKNKIDDIIVEYKKLCDYKNLKVKISYDIENEKIYCNDLAYNTKTMVIEGNLDEVHEDFRDFLRRRGIKFFTGLPFKSILPEGYKSLMEII